MSIPWRKNVWTGCTWANEIDGRADYTSRFELYTPLLEEHIVHTTAILYTYITILDESL